MKIREVQGPAAVPLVSLQPGQEFRLASSGIGAVWMRLRSNHLNPGRVQPRTGCVLAARLADGMIDDFADDCPVIPVRGEYVEAPPA